MNQAMNDFLTYLAALGALTTPGNFTVKRSEDAGYCRSQFNVGDYFFSCITGTGAFGGDEGLLEIAVSSADGKFVTSRLGVDDDVIGYLSARAAIGYVCAVMDWHD